MHGKRILMLPNEDFGRSNEHLDEFLRSPFQGCDTGFGQRNVEKCFENIWSQYEDFGGRKNISECVFVELFEALFNGL